MHFNEQLYYFKKSFTYSFFVLRVLTLCKSEQAPRKKLSVALLYKFS